MKNFDILIKLELTRIQNVKDKEQIILNPFVLKILF